MNKIYRDPGDPDVVAAILKHQASLTREQWQERLDRIPGIIAEQRPGVLSAEEDSRSAVEPIYRNGTPSDVRPDDTAADEVQRPAVRRG